MCKIYIHGILGNIFGKYFEFKVNNVKEAINAIDANKIGFKNKLINLQKQNFSYIVLADGDYINDKNKFLERKKIKELHILPIISGSGQAVAVAIGLTTTAATGAVTLTTTGMIVATLVNVAISAAISVGVSFIMSAFTKQSTPPQQRVAIGGTASASIAQGRSYIFNNSTNVTAQGTAIPIGYGRMKIGSTSVLNTVKNYSTNQYHYKVFSQDFQVNTYNEYLSN